MRLIWNHGEGLVDNGTVCWPISEKPTLPFAFDGIFFDDLAGHGQHLKGAGQHPLSPEEQAQVQAYVSSLKAPAPVVHPFAYTEEILSTAAQHHMDKVARARGYDNLASAISYTGSTVKRYADDAAGAHRLRDATWQYAHDQFELMKDGKRALPTAADFVKELPQESDRHATKP